MAATVSSCSVGFVWDKGRGNTYWERYRYRERTTQYTGGCYRHTGGHCWSQRKSSHPHLGPSMEDSQRKPCFLRHPSPVLSRKYCFHFAGKFWSLSNSCMMKTVLFDLLWRSASKLLTSLLSTWLITISFSHSGMYSLQTFSLSSRGVLCIESLFSQFSSFLEFIEMTLERFLTPKQSSSLSYPCSHCILFSSLL